MSRSQVVYLLMETFVSVFSSARKAVQVLRQLYPDWIIKVPVDLAGKTVGSVNERQLVRDLLTTGSIIAREPVAAGNPHGTEVDVVRKEVQ